MFVKSKKVRLFKSAIYFVLIYLAGLSVIHAQTKTVTVASGWARPPYIIPSNNTGFELELIQQVLRDINLDTEFRYASSSQNEDMLRKGSVDLALTLKRHSNIDSIKLSDVYVVYQNVAVSLKTKKLHIETIKD